MYHARRGPGGALVFYEMGESLGEYGPEPPSTIIFPTPAPPVHGVALRLIQPDIRTGMVGGSQIQDHFFGQYCEVVLGAEGRTLSGHQKQYFMTEFHRLKKEIDTAEGLEPYMRTIHCEGTMHIAVTNEVIKATLNDAIKGPFQALIDVIKQWVDSDPGEGTTRGGSNAHRLLQVVASGGTVRSSLVKEYIADACERVDFDPPIFVDELSDDTGTHYPYVLLCGPPAFKMPFWWYTCRAVGLI